MPVTVISFEFVSIVKENNPISLSLSDDLIIQSIKLRSDVIYTA